VPTTAANNGTYTLTARARDAAGNTTTSAPVTVTIDNTAPTVSLSAPANGATVAGTVTLTAAAADNTGVTGVQFLVNNIVIADDTSGPYSLSVPTTAANNGTYTLTARARDAAGNTTTSAPVTITVDNTAPVISLIGDINLTGSLSASPVWSADGTRAVVTSFSADAAGPITRVAVINLATGAQSGTTVALTGSGYPMLSADGTRALITTTAGDVTAGVTTRASVINTITGTQIGNTVTVAGLRRDPLLSADGTRAVISTHATDGTTTQVAVINLATGTQIGNTVTLPGSQSVSSLLGTDGTHALITSAGTDATGTTTRAAVINTTTGTQTGTTLTVTGVQLSSPLLSANGTRAVITTTTDAPVGGPYVTRVAVINTATGAQAGTTVAVSGSLLDSPVLSTDGTRLLIATSAQDATGYTTRMAAINTVTGTQIGTTVTVTGALPVLLFSADGSRAVVSTTEGNSTTGFSTRMTHLDAVTGDWGTSLPVLLTGDMSGKPEFSDDGLRAVITSYFRDANNIDKIRVAVIDTTTGSPLGPVLTLTGQAGYPAPSALFSADGSRAVITTNLYDSGTSTNTVQVVVIDTSTGTPTGTTTTLTGFLEGPPLLSPDRSRMVFRTQGDDLGTGTTFTQVAMIDTSTGTQVGSTFNLASNRTFVALSADGTLALITTGSQQIAIDTATGLYGSLTGTDGIYPLLSPDGTRGLAVTYTANPTAAHFVLLKIV